MGTLHFNRNWDEVKRRIKAQYGFLTDEDLEVRDGGEDELLERLENKLHIPKQTIRDYIESL